MDKKRKIKIIISMKKAVDMYISLKKSASIKDYRKVIKALRHVMKLDVRGSVMLPDSRKLLGEETSIKEFATTLLVTVLKRLAKK